MSRTLVIVRHGNTFAADEPPRRIGARTDLPLVPSGQDQAHRLGIWFAEQGWRFGRILCSPLRRTRETADIVRAAQTDPPPVEPSALLAEIDHGVDEDRPERDVVARVGTDALATWDKRGVAPDGWTADREARIEGWRALFAPRDDDTVLLVTSNGAARFALLANPELAMQARQLPTLKLRTGAFGIIRVADNGLQLAAWDQRP